MAMELTKQGLSLQAQLAFGGKLEITSALAANGTVDISVLQDQTDLTGDTIPLDILSFVYDPPNQMIISVQADGSSLSTAFAVWQIGVFAKEFGTSDEPILYTIMQSDAADVIPPFGGSFIASSIYELIIAHNNATEVVVNVNTGVTPADFEAHVNNENPDALHVIESDFDPNAGVMKLPNGFMMQWGTYLADTASLSTIQTGAIFYPINFVGSAVATITPFDDGYETDVKVSILMLGNENFSYKLSNVPVLPGDGRIVGFTWQAIGRWK